MTLFRATLAGVASRRIVGIVALCAAAAVAAVVGITLLQTRGEHSSFPVQPGQPPLELEFGLRRDPEAQALFRAQSLFDKNHDTAAAAAIFRRYHSVEAQLGVAFTSWSGAASLGAVQRIAAAHPNDPAVMLNLGSADYWAGQRSEALTEWQRTARAYADSGYGVDAEDALHPQYPIPGLPPIATDLSAPRNATVATLKRAAAKPDANAKLLYGSVLWNAKMPLSAEQQFSAAAKLAPGDPLARTLAAVGLFSKADPRKAFGQLGPLTAVFPHSAIVQFHLAVLLLYIRETKKAAEHFHETVADAPHSPYATYARTFLASMARTRSK